MPFLVIRDNFIQRVVHQRTGYWKPDGEGIEVVAPQEWAAALNLLAGRQEGAFVRGAQALLEQRADVLALKVADLGLLNYPASRGLTEARRQALDRLRVRHQGSQPVQVHRLFGMGEGRSGARGVMQRSGLTRCAAWACWRIGAAVEHGRRVSGRAARQACRPAVDLGPRRSTIR